MKLLQFCFLILFSNFGFSQLKLDSIAVCNGGSVGCNDLVVSHTGYVLSFNYFFHQANWVAYLLTESMTEKVFERTDKFIADSLISGTDLTVDYRKSGYDRGHLAPAADMAFSEIAMKESFYYSNMSPQVPGFNRGIWKKLEVQTRNWAIEYDSLYIVVGPIFSDTMKVIGPHRVAVPNAFYKVILDNHKGKEKMIGFVMKNEGSKNDLQTFVVSVDSIEVLTGIDFFPLLEDEVEEHLESLIVFEVWSWTDQ
jgi:endonuclease G, mitochondrial